nr:MULTISPECIES: hypothetical protein [Shinella]
MQFIAICISQKIKLPLRLYAFGRRSNAERVREVNDGPHDFQRLFIFPQPGNELSIDLELIDRETPKIGKAAIARAEVIQHNPETAASQILEGCSALLVIEKDMLCHLDLELLRTAAQRPNPRLRLLGKYGRTALERRNVYRHEPVRVVVSCPGGPIKDNLAEGVDEAGRLSLRQELGRAAPTIPRMRPTDQSFMPDKRQILSREEGLVMDDDLSLAVERGSEISHDRLLPLKFIVQGLRKSTEP